MMESQRWFLVVVAVISLGVPALCWHVLRPELALLSPQSTAAVALLFVFAIPGLFRMAWVFLPLVLAKCLPRLDQSS